MSKEKDSNPESLVSYYKEEAKKAFKARDTAKLKAKKFKFAYELLLKNLEKSSTIK